MTDLEVVVDCEAIPFIAVKPLVARDVMTFVVVAAAAESAPVVDRVDVVAAAAVVG